jgi:predicted nucleic acid-binding protein
LTVPILDTNILLRHLTGDHVDHSPRATAFMQRVEAGEVQVRLLDTVVFETVFTLQKRFKQSKRDIRDNLLPIIDLPDVLSGSKKRLHETFALYVERNISFGDAFHVRVALDEEGGEIVTFDRAIGRIPGVSRTEPA